MSIERFYFKTEARKALEFAISRAQKQKIERVVLYIDTQKNLGWFDELFSRDFTKRLLKEEAILPEGVRACIKTKKTYDGATPSSEDVVLCFGTGSRDLRRLEDMSGVKDMILISSSESDSAEWIRSRIVIDAETRKPVEPEQPTAIVKMALKLLTESINLSTGILHPSDERLAKTYIRALHRYENRLDGLVVDAYLVNHLEWCAKHAQEVKRLIDILNDGRYFKGGDTKGLAARYKSWKKKVGEY